MPQASVWSAGRSPCPAAFVCSPSSLRSLLACVGPAAAVTKPSTFAGGARRQQRRSSSGRTSAASPGSGVYAQRLDGAGAAQWTNGAWPCATATGAQQNAPDPRADARAARSSVWDDHLGFVLEIKRWMRRSSTRRASRSGRLAAMLGRRSERPERAGRACCSTETGGLLVDVGGTSAARRPAIACRSLSPATPASRTAVDPRTASWRLGGAAGDRLRRSPCPSGAGGAIAAMERDTRLGGYGPLRAAREQLSAPRSGRRTASRMHSPRRLPGVPTPSRTRDGAGNDLRRVGGRRAGRLATATMCARSSSALSASHGGRRTASWSASSGSPDRAAIMSDGASGAIVARNGTAGPARDDDHAQQLDASGAVQWTANGASWCARQRQPGRP